MIGGTSSPVNVRCLLFDLPTSKPMKLPESRVPNPDTPLRVTRGSTTQNFASATIRSPAFLSILAVTSTFEWSEESCTAVTCPMFTSLYLMKVLPASTPWAALKRMVMVGPSLRMRWIAMPIATTAARIGMIQTTEIRWRRLGTTVARGRLSGLSAMAFWSARFRIPDQAWVEGFCRDHC